MSLLTRLTAPRARRSVVLASVVALLVAAGVVVVLLMGGGDGGTGSPAAGASPTPTQAPTSTEPPELAPAPVTPEPTGPTEDASVAPPTLAPVGFDAQAAVGNGITAEVVSLEAVEGSGQGPGQIAGPALRATVRITNGTTGPVSLDGVAVDLAHGTELAPASPLEDPSRAPFSGTVQPSESAVGVYVFTVPADDRELVQLTVGYQAGAPFMVFTGSAA
jgi:hypothetical protein